MVNSMSCYVSIEDTWKFEVLVFKCLVVEIGIANFIRIKKNWFKLFTLRKNRNKQGKDDVPGAELGSAMYWTCASSDFKWEIRRR